MTPPVSSVPVILEKTAARRMVWVDVARVVACILIIANHMAFYSAELYRWIWAEFLAARTPFFLLAAGYFVGRGSFGPLDGGSLFLWRRSWFLLRPYLVWGLVAAVLIGWSPLHEYYASYRPMYEWLEGEEGAGFWPALAAFGRCLGIAGHPVDAPMWFLRDIIIYTAAAPLLYRLGDYLLWAGMVMLSLNYFALDLADHDYPIANSLGFFLLGMYVSRYSLPFLTEAVRRYAVPFLAATPCAYLVAGRPPGPAQLHAHRPGHAGADVPGHSVHGMVSARCQVGGGAGSGMFFHFRNALHRHHPVA